MDWHKGNPDLIIDAALAQAAYSGTSEVHGWQKDIELSNENRTVYHKEGKARVAFRGTNVRNPRDLGTDALLALGLQDKSSRMKNAVRTTDLAIKKYGKENVSLTGHSLGGAQAAYVSRKKGVEATGFNTFMSPVDVARKRTYSKFHSVQTRSDPIAQYTTRVGRIGRKTFTRSTKWNPHAISNFV
jgi:hypothetical protein